mmetsp:Transcript_11858/g.32504  ORF Transcript_11858/g.32504 Transcript_11858/m.32504 type:complete len:223 (+) Transcript_11858:315-983(+)
MPSATRFSTSSSGRSRGPSTACRETPRDRRLRRDHPWTIASASRARAASWTPRGSAWSPSRVRPAGTSRPSGGRPRSPSRSAGRRRRSSSPPSGPWRATSPESTFLSRAPPAAPRSPGGCRRRTPRRSTRRRCSCGRRRRRWSWRRAPAAIGPTAAASSRGTGARAASPRGSTRRTTSVCGPGAPAQTPSGPCVCSRRPTLRSARRSRRPATSTLSATRSAS